jgi:hypothetical protein
MNKLDPHRVFNVPIVVGRNKLKLVPDDTQFTNERLTQYRTINRGGRESNSDFTVNTELNEHGLRRRMSLSIPRYVMHQCLIVSLLVLE